MIDEKLLTEAAIQAKEMSYSPYSHFRVGAALLGKSGTIYQGCNIENASYGATNCAERTAVFKAISEGEREFRAIAIAGDCEEYISPCGICRQVLLEFCKPQEFLVLMLNGQGEWCQKTLDELIPNAFTTEKLG